MASIAFTPAATRQWVNLSESVRVRINTKLEHFAATRQGDVKKLKGRAGARLRIGDWRVIFYEKRNTIIVVAFAPSRDSTTQTAPIPLCTLSFATPSHG